MTVVNPPDGIVGPWMLALRKPGALDEPVGARLHYIVLYIVLRPSRAEALRRAQARTSPDALVDAGPVTALWDQFADLGELERHVIDTTTQTEDATLAAVQRAVAGGEFLLLG